MTSDDVFLDIFSLLQLKQLIPLKKPVIFCPIVKNELIDRTNTSPYSVAGDWSPEEERFPEFCSDLVYVMTPSAVDSILISSTLHEKTLHHLDNVWVTGYLSRSVAKVDISHLVTHHPVHYVVVKMSQHPAFYSRDFIAGSLVNKYTEERTNITQVLTRIKKV